MGRLNDYTDVVDTILYTDFNERRGYVVPTTDTVTLRDGAVELDAVYVYADMADSTGMASRFIDTDAARIVRSFLSIATRALKYRGGEIRSYDGDRVMAIYIGSEAATNAAIAALELKWLVDNLLDDSLRVALPSYRNSTWKISHRSGIDTGEAYIVRAGVRDNSDLVSIGDAPNIAAKLSDLKGAHRTAITDRVWDKMNFSACYSSKEGNPPMWTDPVRTDIGGGRSEFVRTSAWGRVVP